MAKKKKKKKPYEAQEPNPFAICNAMAKRLGWSPEKTERCILEAKADTGFDMLEAESDRIFMSAFGRPVNLFELYHEWMDPGNDGAVIFTPESIFDQSEPDWMLFIAAPFSVYGGKRFLANKIAPILPPHDRYVEPFAGAAAVMFAKAAPSRSEILVDIDYDKVNLLRVLRDHDEGTKQKLLSMPWTPSKEYFTQLRDSDPQDPVERVHRYMYTRWNSFGSRGDSWAVTGANRHERYITQKMPRYKERLKNVTIFHGDWKEAIRRFDEPSTFFYLDPPYLGTANSRAKHFEEPSAQELAEAITPIKGKWLLSNHDVPELHQVFSAFKIHRVDVPTTVDQMHATAKRSRPEILIGNFDFQEPQIAKRTPAPVVAGGGSPPVDVRPAQ